MTRASEPASLPARPYWLVSARWDLAFVLGPLLGVALVSPLLRGAVSGWGWALLVLGVDVAHVWSTIFRTYLDPDELRRRPRLYGLTPLVAAVGCVGLSFAAPAWFWTVLAYFAVFHFVRQPIGFAAVYRLRAGLNAWDQEARVERLALYAVMLGSVVWWHANLPRPFDWFVEGDFLIGLPAWAGDLGLGAALVGVLAFGVARLRGGRWNPGGDLWFVGTAACWLGGIVLTASDAAFSVTNVISHGVPYVALIGLLTRRRYERAGRGPGGSLVGVGWALLLVVPIALALAEEAAWDGLVSHDRPWLFGDWPEQPFWVVRLATGLLAVPQVTHYLLDGFIWKLGPQNPELRGLLGPG